MPKGFCGFQKGHKPFKGTESTQFKVGQKPHNKGKKFPELQREKSKFWKGDKATYTAIHMDIYKHFGKADCCQNVGCVYPRKNSKGVLLKKPKRYNWANMSGEYRRERDDWVKLCPSCHQKRDRGIIKINLK